MGVSFTKKTATVVVTGAAGQISYSLLFRIATGEMLGSDQPVHLSLLEVPQAVQFLEGVKLELEDGAYPLLDGVSIHDQAESAFRGADYALLVGAMPRGPGMQRADLLQKNADIFSVQGKAINAVASRDIKVLVVGNPANTNCLITASNAPDIDTKQFTCMMRLDHNRAISMLASHLERPAHTISQMSVWGNHSVTQYPCLQFAQVEGVAALDLVQEDWYKNTYIPKVANRGAAIIEARGGKSSVASAAQAALDHMKSWVLGSNGSWVSMGVPSDGSYGVEAGIIYSYPVTCTNGTYTIIPDLALGDFSKEKIAQSAAELLQEKQAVAHLL